ncbi:hypothetical protein D5S19_15990 [Amycolatopsis panacis]|uniref:Uncharacterized protein n=1 Tax=Amycolatopsis panacis TaxID=2340917 RepID=A0A419I3L6_9PSEU|nr:hypothetical protein D5S19_15990 [Amycolatopsis panacis]
MSGADRREIARLSRQLDTAFTRLTKLPYAVPLLRQHDYALDALRQARNGGSVSAAAGEVRRFAQYVKNAR